MSKYEKLFNYVNGKKEIQLTFEEVEKILGFKIDHSFLKYKKELPNYEIKISLKNQNIIFKSLK